MIIYKDKDIYNKYTPTASNQITLGLLTRPFFRKPSAGTTHLRKSFSFVSHKCKHKFLINIRSLSSKMQPLRHAK